MGHQVMICRDCGREWSIVELEDAASASGHSLTCPACEGHAFGV